MNAATRGPQTYMPQTENPSDAVYSSHAQTASRPAQFPALREFLAVDKKGGFSARGAHIDTCMTQTESPPDAVSRCSAALQSKNAALGGFLPADKKGGFSERGVHLDVHDPNRKPA